ncbi:MAG TPA: LamG domain-containing protein [Polyangia bacterium]
MSQDCPRTRPFASRLAAVAFPLLALLGACRDSPPGVRIDLQIGAEEFRPAFARIYWMRPGRVPFEIRLPEFGEFINTNDAVVGSLYIETVGALNEPRAVAVRGFRGDREISGGVMRIESSASEKRHVLVVLREPLADDDNNGTPDVVDRDCLDEVDQSGCREPGNERDAGTGNTDTAMPDRDAGAEMDVTRPVDMAPEVQLPSTEGLIAHWRFDDEMTSRMAVDSSGNGNLGTLRGNETVFAQGRTGGSVDIPGLNNGVTVAASGSTDSIQAAFTIGAWVYRTANRNGTSYILSRRSTGTNKVYGLALTADGMPRLILNSQMPPANTPVTSSMAVPTNTWAHVAATFDGREVRLFINGVDVKAALVSTTVRMTGTPLCVGCGHTSDTVIADPIAGRMDDVRLYARALTSDEIAALAR